MHVYVSMHIDLYTGLYICMFIYQYVQFVLHKMVLPLELTLWFGCGSVVSVCRLRH